MKAMVSLAVVIFDMGLLQECSVMSEDISYLFLSPMNSILLPYLLHTVIAKEIEHRHCETPIKTALKFQLFCKII